MRRCILTLLPLAALILGGCAVSRDATSSRSQPNDASSLSSDIAASREATAVTQRLLDPRLGTRPDCRNGQVIRIIPAHSGWDSLRGAGRGLMRYPGADRAVLLSPAGRRATVVLYRSNDTVKAAAHLSRLDSRWFPDSITLCRSTLS